MKQRIGYVLLVILISVVAAADKTTKEKKKQTLKSIDEFRIKAPLDTKSKLKKI